MATAATIQAQPDDLERLVLIHERNLAAMRGLAEKLAGERPPAAFVGAGLTARSGLPTWDGLIANLVKQISTWKKGRNASPAADMPTQSSIDKLKFSTDDLLWKANYCFEHFRAAERVDDYFKTLGSQFAKCSKDNVVLDGVVGLPFSQFLTTNYDPAICDAHLRVRRSKLKAIDWGLYKLPVALPSSPRAARSCVHLHGCHSRPKGIVLRECDYQAHYLENQQRVDVLKKFLQSNPVVFIGYSLNDLDVMNVLRMLKAGDPADRGSHYAILPLSDEKPEQFIEMEECRLNDKYGIQPIFYRRLTNNFMGLEEAIKLLTRYVRLFESNSQERAALRATPAVTVNPDPFTFDPADLLRPKFPDDPNKHAFGKSAQRNGRKLTARVTRTGDDSRWFRIELTIQALSGSPNLRHGGEFYAHPTFPKQIYNGKLEKGGRRITRKFWAYGAFTVGVLVDDGKTALELDLADLKTAPKDFRER